MTSSEPSASAERQPVVRQARGPSAVPVVLAAAARALAAAPSDADDAALLAILAEAIMPTLGDVVEVRRLGDRGRDGRNRELVAHLDGDGPGSDLLVIRSTDPAREYGEAERSAVEVLAALIGARRAACRQAHREATLRQQIETVSVAGRELAHALNNDLTMPVGVIELLADRTSVSPDLQEMLQAAAKDLATLEQHVRTFHDLMRAQTGGSTLP